MNLLLCLIAVIVVTCIILNNASDKIGMPVLLAFILLGIFFGNNGLVPIKFDNYSFAENICTVALIFIMFYGGFGTRWESAKPVILPSALLASLGVVMTAGLTGLFCRFVLSWGWVESFLMGSVISSTDAASVFSILRAKKLGLKNNTAPMLEVESGSNDPFSYMLTVLMISLLNGSASGGSIAWMLFAQLVFGAGFGWLIAKISIYAIKRLNFPTSGFDSLFVFAVALFSYAVPSLVGGNGYLSTYIVGMMLGNCTFKGKKNMVGFFDGLTGLMQVLVFFLLGLLARPALMVKVLLPAVLIFFFILLFARPCSVYLILMPFRKFMMKQKALVSFVGLRGASSIVFAIFATVSDGVVQNDILNIVFCIVLLSISLQGYFIPFMARKLDMIDKDADVMKTFSDFSEETELIFSEVSVPSQWDGKKVKDVAFPVDILICKCIAPDGTDTVPNGDTVFNTGDKLIVCSQACVGKHSMRLSEKTVSKGSKDIGKTIKEYAVGTGQILLIQRGQENIIPRGDTVLMEGDRIFYNHDS